jgi:hypothetical protein
MVDLETFIIMIYVFVAEWYEREIAPTKKKRGRPSACSDAEILTLALLSEWRAGVPWQSERACLRYLHRHYAAWFPTMPQRSAFNQRKRYLFGVLVALQADLSQSLCCEGVLYEAVDSLPLPAASLAQCNREKGHWLFESAIGKASINWFFGDRLLMSVSPQGCISGWLLGAANINDRWLLEAFLSTRAGCAQLQQPPRNTHQAYNQISLPPRYFIGAFTAVGQALARVYLADGNFNGQRWIKQWQHSYQAQVISPPHKGEKVFPWSKQWASWLRRQRQIIETVFALLQQVFRIKQLGAHSRWGQYTRIAAKTAAFNLGLLFNQRLERPLLALETLLC